MIYDDFWFKKSTIEEIEKERERVRLKYCSAGNNFNVACELQNLLARFDEEIRKKTYKKQEVYKYLKNREHGWYLQNDD